MSQITFAEAINHAFIDSMKVDSKVLCMGLGVPDPKGVFGTTLNLEKLYGKERVFDIPTSENALTGYVLAWLWMDIDQFLIIKDLISRCFL